MVKIGDLGLGRQFSGSTFKAKSLVGTPYYMSYERLLEQSYDYKADVWSLGCVLYELCTLASPFWKQGLNLTGLIRKVKHLDYPALNEDVYSKFVSFLLPHDEAPKHSLTVQNATLHL